MKYTKCASLSQLVLVLLIVLVLAPITITITTRSTSRMRWNLSSRARALSEADAVVLSIPKSGRTWLRVFLSGYFSAKSEGPFSLGITEERAEGVPRLVYSHDWFEHRTKADAWERLRGKYLLPPAALRQARILLLARDPRDAFVSYYFQLTRRHHPAPDRIKQLSMAALLRHPRFGIGSMVNVMNAWVREFRARPHFTILRYEDLRADPSRTFRDVLQRVGEERISEHAFAYALQFSSFENMQKLEATGAFGDKILRPRDAADPQSFKVRRGTAGGFAEHFSSADRKLAAEICRKLDPIFGYHIAAERAEPA